MKPKHPNQLVRFKVTREHIKRETERIQSTWDDIERRRRSIGTKATLADGALPPVEVREIALKDIEFTRKYLA